ncbi:hypothetical protein CDAR_471101 [Caerostris darwini]|uniref:Uncharacterized protein n=1 Tax=Caerostris darwini TaxID=1538125 RepID=A0AAV4QPV4_9ARAC|nr:hypothetical protein CDAR_471101 [Caerostris darwini]
MPHVEPGRHSPTLPQLISKFNKSPHPISLDKNTFHSGGQTDAANWNQPKVSSRTNVDEYERVSRDCPGIGFQPPHPPIPVLLPGVTPGNYSSSNNVWISLSSEKIAPEYFSGA